MKKQHALQPDLELQLLLFPLLSKLLPFQLDLELPIEGHHLASFFLPCSPQTITKEMRHQYNITLNHRDYNAHFLEVLLESYLMRTLS